MRRQDGLPVAKSVWKRYENQKNRGIRGYGYIAIDKNGYIQKPQRAEEEAGIKDRLLAEDSSAILFHHRTPTSTPNYEEATHPIVVENDYLKSNYYVIHNGVVHNEDKLKAEHEKLGFKYTTAFTETKAVWFGDKETVLGRAYGFNDSEAVAIEVALFLAGKKDTIDFDGSASIIVLETTKKGKVKAIHYGHNYMNPLIEEKIGRGAKQTFCLKSEGDGVAKKQDVFFTMDWKTGEVTEEVEVEIGNRRPAIVNNINRPMGYGRHDHYDEPSHRRGRDDERDYSPYGYDDLGIPPMRKDLLPVLPSHATKKKLSIDEDGLLSQLYNLSREDIKKKLEDIETEMSWLQKDLDDWREMHEAEDDYVSKMSIKVEITEKEIEFNTLRNKYDTIMDGLRELEEQGTESPYLQDLFPAT